MLILLICFFTIRSTGENDLKWANINYWKNLEKVWGWGTYILQHVVKTIESHAQDQYLNLMGFIELMFLFEEALCKMFPIKGFHFWNDEEVSVSQYNRIAQNQRNLYEIVMNHDSRNCQSVWALNLFWFISSELQRHRFHRFIINKLLGSTILSSLELVRTEQIF